MSATGKPTGTAGKPSGSSAGPAATVSIMGVKFSKLTLDETLDHLGAIADSDRPDTLHHIVTANPEIVMSAQKNEALRRILQEAALITPDGIGIVLAAKWKGQPLSGRVTGYDMLIRLLETGSRRGWTFYFLGTDEETSRKAVEQAGARYPGLRIVGRHHGFFKSEEEPAIVAEIAAAAPDFLIVAMGAPHAEHWISRNKRVLRAKIAIGVGGSLDIVAGKVKRAPQIWQRLGLEWLHRLLSQPSRWRRQLILPVFAVQALLRRNDND